MPSPTPTARPSERRKKPKKNRRDDGSTARTKPSGARSASDAEKERKRKKDEKAGKGKKADEGKKAGKGKKVGKGKKADEGKKAERKGKKAERKGKKADEGKKAERKATMAERADRHDLYQRAVQTPQTEVEFFTRVFEEARDRTPMSLREDFCGTANLACTWVASAPGRRAIGVDLDRPTLDWGRKHNLRKLDAGARKRVTLYQANVLEGVGERTDMVCAMNFSYCVFKRREQLRHYFEIVHDRLVEDGIFVTEAYGGLEAVVALEEKRKCDGFTYVWEQEKFNPITYETLCHIHFRFRDKSRIDRAFTYDWRLWTLPELRELLAEAGFRQVTVWWEDVDEDGDGSGEYHPTEEEENQESWLVYLVAEK